MILRRPKFFRNLKKTIHYPTLLEMLIIKIPTLNRKIVNFVLGVGVAVSVHTW